MAPSDHITMACAGIYGELFVHSVNAPLSFVLLLLMIVNKMCLTFSYTLNKKCANY